jgi:lipoprotein-anchoring transpeptidase ErfK/SrfK
MTFRSNAMLTVATIFAVAGLAVSSLPAQAASTSTVPGPTSLPKVGSSLAPKDLVVPPVPVSGTIATRTLVAASLTRFVNVFDSPTSKKASLVMDNRKNFSGRHVFVVVGKQDNWLNVLVPARPNGRRGWVKISEVGVFEHDFHMVVSLSTFTLTLYKSGEVVQTEKIAIGQNKWPTPTGIFFIRELAKPANPKGAYGSYAFGLSGYSNVLTKFGRGDGQIGIHGTNAPAALGTKASHGCVRVNNAGITKLAKTLPQGVIVDIQA